jgi:hypothetical protein
MILAEAKSAVGKMVMSRDAGHKLIRAVADEHGPYLLKQVTKGGRAIIARWEDEDLSVPPSLLSSANDQDDPHPPENDHE